MIFGSLESQRRTLQDNEVKHHSPRWEVKTKWGNMKPLKIGTTGKTSNIKNQEAFHTNFVFDELELVMKITTSSETSQREKLNKKQER